MLAETGVILVFAGLFIVGLVAFVIGLIVMCFKLVGWLARGVFGVGDRHPAIRRAKAAKLVKGRVQCTRSGCGFLNRPEARFCGGCGRPLDPANRDIDAYG